MSSGTATSLSIPAVVVTDVDAKTKSVTSHAASPSTDSPADILTFRYVATNGKGKQVWVDAPDSYNTAIDRVMKEFSRELKGYDRDDIALVVGAKMGDANGIAVQKSCNGKVRIGRTDEAWRLVLSTLVRYEIVEIYVDHPSIVPAPPAYTPATIPIIARAPIVKKPASIPTTGCRCRHERSRTPSPIRRVASWLQRNGN